MPTGLTGRQRGLSDISLEGCEFKRRFVLLITKEDLRCNLNNLFAFRQMFIQIHKPKGTGEMISLERRLYEVVQKEWDSQEPIGHSFAQQTQKDVSTAFYWY